MSNIDWFKDPERRREYYERFQNDPVIAAYNRKILEVFEKFTRYSGVIKSGSVQPVEAKAFLVPPGDEMCRFINKQKEDYISRVYPEIQQVNINYDETDDIMRGYLNTLYKS